MLNPRVALIVVVLANVLFGGHPAQANLIVNGGFEDPQIASKPTLGAYTTLNAAVGWTASAPGLNSQGATLISSYDTKYFPSFWEVAGGHQAALFNEGTGTDFLYQSFATTPGTVYNVTFDLASERGGPAGPAIDFYAQGGPLNVHTGVHFATPIGTPFVHESFSFTATELSSYLYFQSTGDNGVSAFSPILDNVNVEKASSTPEPGSLVLLCTGLASMGGLGWIKKRKVKVVAA